MQSNEVVIKLMSKLERVDKNTSGQQIRSMIEGVLHNYDINIKETLPAIIDDMNEKIMLYLATKNIEGLSKITLKGYSRILIRFANHIRKNVEDITAMDIRVYLSNYGKTGVKNSTIVSYTDVLRGFFNWLEDEEYIKKSPMKKIKTMKVEREMRKALTKEQFETLRTGAKTLRQKAVLEVLYATGCRLSEVEGMKKRDVDWQTLTIKVVGKGDKERVVYLNATAQVHLKRYLMSRLDDSDALFVTQRKPIVYMGKRAIQKEISKIAEQSGIEVRVYPHIIRHSFATHMINSGMDLTVLQSIMGHESSETTLVYASLSNQTIENQYRQYS